MKNLLLKTLAALTFVGGGILLSSCESETGTSETPVFEVTSSRELPVDAEGRQFEIKINTNFAPERISAVSDSDWIVTDSATKSGSSVRFTATVEANDTGYDREGTITVSVDDPQFEAVVITVTQVSSMIFALTSESEVEIKQTGGEFNIEISTNYETDELNIEGNNEWLEVGEATKEGLTVTIPVTVKANNTYDPRTGEITVTAPDAEPAVVTVTQEYIVKFNVSPQSYDADAEGEEFEVKVDTNIEYEVSSDSEWVKVGEKTESGVKLTVDAYTNVVARNATVTFTQTSGPKTGGQYISRKVTISQTYVDPSSGIANFIDFSTNYAYPASWANPSAINNLNEYTVELVVYLKEGSKPFGFACHTPLFNCRNTCAIAAYPPMTTWTWKAGSITTYQQASGTFTAATAAKTAHLAMTTAADGTFSLYVDGAKVIDNKQGGATAPYNFASESGSFESGNCLYLGFMASTTHTPTTSFITSIAGQGMDNGTTAAMFQLIQGGVAEVRIWNRQLTASEITAEGHFFSVDPSSSGLLAYWKCNEKSGTTLKDSTSNGNNLTLYTDITLLE